MAAFMQNARTTWTCRVTMSDDALEVHALDRLFAYPSSGLEMRSSSAYRHPTMAT